MSVLLVAAADGAFRSPLHPYRFEIAVAVLLVAAVGFIYMIARWRRVLMKAEPADTQGSNVVFMILQVALWTLLSVTSFADGHSGEGILKGVTALFCAGIVGAMVSMWRLTRAATNDETKATESVSTR